MKNISIIIPSLDPNEHLSSVVSALREQGFEDIILIDDGSKEENKRFFPKGEGITLLSHPINFGKGAALKTGLSFVLTHRPSCVGVVTCDGDGQHLAVDVKRVAEAMEKSEKFILGVRDFSLPNVPKKSRVGNRVSSVALRLCSGVKTGDTQTGLRGIPAKFISDLIEVDGSRFEYETNVLLSLRQLHVPYAEVKIETVYLNENKGTHYRPIKDTVRIFKCILSYIFSSAVSFITDIVLFRLLSGFFGIGVIISTAAARAVSSIVNFAVNRKVVFHSSVSLPRSLLKYYLLAVPVMLVSAFGVKGLAYLLKLDEASLAVTLIKIVIDCILFILNYKIQKKWIFQKRAVSPALIKKNNLKKKAAQSKKADAFVSKSDREKAKKEKKERKKAKKEAKRYRLTWGKVIRRFFLSIFTVLICAFILLYTCLYILVNGGCEPLRDKLVLSAMQASATKWVPGLFMSQKTVDEIVAKSYEVNTYVITLDDYHEQISEGGENTQRDKWKNAVDGMIFEVITGKSFTGYVLQIKDPSRIFVGTSSDYSNPNTKGINIFDMAKKEDAIAIINAGEFYDVGGQGTGNRPIGITFSKGNLVWEDSYKRTFIAFDKNDKLIVTEPMTKKEALELGIRDGVSFQNGNVLITNEDGNITLHYADGNTGTAQRSAIGQAADGTVIMLVTDGRSASSLGATRNDVIDVMVSYGAITAGMLDGGSSSLMYYENYFDKFGYNTDKLDQYQKKGLVNRYKAFTPPRRMPTYFCVAREDTNAGGEQNG